MTLLNSIPEVYFFNLGISRILCYIWKYMMNIRMMTHTVRIYIMHIQFYKIRKQIDGRYKFAKPSHWYTSVGKEFKSIFCGSTEMYSFFSMNFNHFSCVPICEWAIKWSNFYNKKAFFLFYSNLPTDFTAQVWNGSLLYLQ